MREGYAHIVNNKVYIVKETGTIMVIMSCILLAGKEENRYENFVL